MKASTKKTNLTQEQIELNNEKKDLAKLTKNIKKNIIATISKNAHNNSEVLCFII